MNRIGTQLRRLAVAAALLLATGALADGLAKLPPDYTFPQGEGSPGKVTFSHQSHVDPKAPAAYLDAIRKITPAGAVTIHAEPSTIEGDSVGLIALTFAGMLIGAATYTRQHRYSIERAGGKARRNLILAMVLIALAFVIAPLRLSGEQAILVLIVITIGLFGWMSTARVVRASFLSAREKEYVEAAICIEGTMSLRAKGLTI